MTFREALIEAIEYLREHADPDDQRRRNAAAILARKADRLRVTAEKREAIPRRCFCGEVCLEKNFLCGPCFRVMPMQLLIDRFFARGRAHKKVLADIEAICMLRAEKSSFDLEAAA